VAQSTDINKSESLDSMDITQFGTSKRQIILIIKKAGQISLQELSNQLKMSKMGILKHITPLEESYILERKYVNEGVGRPKLYLTLGKSASDVFPRAYAGLTCSVLEYIEEKLGLEGVEQALTKRQIETFNNYKKVIHNDLSFSDKVEKLSKFREKEGYMVELKMIDTKTFEIQENNCPILEVAEQYQVACGIEKRLFENVLNANVETTHRVVAGNNTCRFIIRDRSK
jgi:DeoR family transcriptional regulator, suf operon transcriptional repressor